MKRMKRLFTKQDKDTIFKLWKDGKGFSDIAKEFTSKPGTIFTVLRETGGIKPVDSKRAAQHLTMAEREEIRVGLSAKKSIREIARFVLVKLRRTLLSENFHTPMGSFHCWPYEAV